MSYANLSERTRATIEADGVLTPKQRAVVQARLNGHSWQRIAMSQDVDEATVRGHWNRALRRLKPHLTEGDLAA